MTDLVRIQAAYAAAHRLNFEAVGFVPFRAVADWWAAEQERREVERRREQDEREEAAR